MTTTADTAAASTAKAGFGTRFLALLIDVVGLGIVQAIIASILNSGNMNGPEPIGTIIGIAYFVYFWSKAGGGQTLGMRALNIKVVKTDGTMLDYVGAFIRYVGFVISCIAIFIGLIWAAFDAQGQGWHDKIAGTYVVKA
jgi:uncharacterized RDD family membrane protein YckC